MSIEVHYGLLSTVHCPLSTPPTIMTARPTTRLDVLHVTEACGGGVARHLELLLPALGQAGLSCGLFGFGARISGDFQAWAEAQASAGVISALAFSPGCGPLAALRQLRGLVRRWHPRVLHMHAFRAGLAGRVGLINGARMPATVYSPHAFGLTPGSGARRLALMMTERLLTRRTDCYMLVSAAEYDDARALGLPPARCRVCENGLPEDYTDTLLDRSEARQRLAIPAENLVLAAPCRLARQKNLDCLIKAIALLRNGSPAAPERPTLHVMLCGDGPEEQHLRRLVQAAGLEGVIRFAGLTPDLPRLLRAFDLAVIPSRYEGLSYALLETLAAQVPLVASDIPANRPRPEWRGCLWPFRDNDHHDLARQITAALQNPAEARQRAQKAGQMVREHFSLTAQCQGLATLYRQLIDNRTT